MGSQITAFILPPELPGEQWIPSNGTVGYSFIGEVCGNCERDRDGECPILARSFIGEAIEWRSTDEEQFCMAYTPAGEPIPEQPCGHTQPLDLGTDKKEK